MPTQFVDDKGKEHKTFLNFSETGEPLNGRAKVSIHTNSYSRRLNWLGLLETHLKTCVPFSYVQTNDAEVQILVSKLASVEFSISFTIPDEEAKAALIEAGFRPGLVHTLG